MERKKPIGKKKKDRIVRYYLTNKDNRISVIAEKFGVKTVVVHKAIDNYFKKLKK